MAKAASIKIKLLSTADTGYFYVGKKNARTKTEKFTFKKYDPIAKKHVEFLFSPSRQRDRGKVRSAGDGELRLDRWPVRQDCEEATPQSI
jgi:large subunit ribosomal protein L33